MLVMQFAQKGIDELRKYQEHMEMRHPEGDFVVSEGFDEGASSCVNLYVSRNPNQEVLWRSARMVPGPLFALSRPCGAR